MSLPNPPVFKDTNVPVALQTLRVTAAGDEWEPCAITAAAVTVPQANIPDTDAPVALTAATVATPNAAAPTGSYVQADEATQSTLANALKSELNKVIADAVALRAELATLTTAHNGLLTKLETAGILSAS